LSFTLSVLGKEKAESHLNISEEGMKSGLSIREDISK
jgi:hypothetical protein